MNKLYYYLFLIIFFSNVRADYQAEQNYQAQSSLPPSNHHTYHHDQIEEKSQQTDWARLEVLEKENNQSRLNLEILAGVCTITLTISIFAASAKYKTPTLSAIAAGTTLCFITKLIAESSRIKQREEEKKIILAKLNK